MDQRLSMVMVGAKDVPALRGFYEQGLGWSPWGPASAISVMYKTGTAVIVFLNDTYLAQESGIAAVAAPKSLFAVFVPAKDDVAPMLAQAVAAGARITSPLRARDGGLYSGYFADPEGNGWEIVWSPHMPLGADGGLTLAG